MLENISFESDHCFRQLVEVEKYLFIAKSTERLPKYSKTDDDDDDGDDEDKDEDDDDENTLIAVGILVGVLVLIAVAIVVTFLIRNSAR